MGAGGQGPPSAGRRVPVAPWRAIAIALGVLAVAPALAQGLGGATGAPALDAATTGQSSELRRTVPITRPSRTAQRIVLSMGPGQLAGLAAGDLLDLSSEVQVTVDCTVHEPRCAGRPYRFDPSIVVTLELARRRSTDGPSRVLARRSLSCGQQEPLRQHHCPVVFAGVKTRVGERFECTPPRCFVNVVVSAHSRRAKGGERVIIGANKPNGRIVQDKSRLNAVRVGPGVERKRLETGGPRHDALPLNPRRKVVLTRRVDGLGRGDVLAVAADLRSDVRGLGYAALVGAELVAARGPKATAPSRLIRRAVSQRGQISPINGTNCTPQDSPCATRKVGVLEVRREIRGASGGRAPLFVNLVVRTKPKRVGGSRGDRLRLRSGAMSVSRYSVP